MEETRLCQLCYSVNEDLPIELPCGHLVHAECLGPDSCFMEGCNGEPKCYNHMNLELVLRVFEMLFNEIGQDDDPRVDQLREEISSHLLEVDRSSLINWVNVLEKKVEILKTIITGESSNRGNNWYFLELRKYQEALRNWISVQHKEIFHAIPGSEDPEIRWPEVFKPLDPENRYVFRIICIPDPLDSVTEHCRFINLFSALAGDEGTELRFQQLVRGKSASKYIFVTHGRPHIRGLEAHGEDLKVMTRGGYSALIKVPYLQRCRALIILHNHGNLEVVAIVYTEDSYLVGDTPWKFVAKEYYRPKQLLACIIAVLPILM